MIFKKYLVSVMLVVCGVFFVNAQKETDLLTTRKNKLNRQYLRPSLSTVVFYDGSTQAREVAGYLTAIGSEQFDANNLNANIDILKVASVADVEPEVTVALKQMEVTKQIMHIWFPQFINEEQGYSFEMLEKRGQYAATDNDVKISEASQRKTMLNNLGEQLIDRSYILAYYLYYDTQSKTVQGKALAYKLDFGKEVMFSFYEPKFYNNPNGIDEFNFPLEFLLEVKCANTNISGVFKNMISSSIAGIAGKSVEKAQLKAETIHEVANVKIGKKIADFEVKTLVAKVRPVKAKIGKKEGLKIDERFDIMELVLDKNGKEKAKRKGTVRVRKVFDNTGFAKANISEKEMSVFYNFAGGGYQEGMTLVKNPELGIGVSAIALTNEVSLKLDYRTKLLPGFFLYMKVAKPMGKNEEDKYGIYKRGKGNREVSFMTFSFGLEKDFHFARNLFIATGIGYGAFGNTKDKNGNKIEVDLKFIDTSGRFGIQVISDLQLFTEVNYKMYFGEDKDVITEDLGSVGFGLGLKCSF